MKRTGYIALFILISAQRAAAQDKGDVVVHSDPRLSMLMKKKHTEAIASVAKPHKRTEVKSPVVPPAQTGSVTPTMVVATTGRTTPVTTTVVSKSAVPGTLPATTTAPAAENAATASAPPYVPENSKPEAATPVAHAPIYIREKEGRVIYSGKGFRVQIYSGADRERAIAIKTEFMRNFPGVRTYISYVSPCFRVKVGNFRTRAEAMGMYRDAKEIYSPVVIVPDNITINTM